MLCNFHQYAIQEHLNLDQTYYASYRHVFALKSLISQNKLIQKSLLTYIAHILTTLNSSLWLILNLQVWTHLTFYINISKILKYHHDTLLFFSNFLIVRPNLRQGYGAALLPNHHFSYSNLPRLALVCQVILFHRKQPVINRGAYRLNMVQIC